jgi:type II secretion system protein I/type II secretion system protein H
MAATVVAAAPHAVGPGRQARRRQAGLSLIEILVVVAILAALVAAITLSVDAVGAPRQLEREARRLAALTELACEQAQLSGHEHGLHLLAEGYGFSVATGVAWRLHDEGALRPRELPAGIALRGARNGVELAAADGYGDPPQVVCFPSGELSPYVATFRAGASATRAIVDADASGRVVVRVVEAAVTRARGFTLLEVVVALAIVALALVGLSRVAGLGAAALDHQRDVTLGSWVAANVIADVRLREGFPPPGKRDGTQRMADRDWRWELTVQDTDEPTIRRLDVRVFAPGRDDAPLTSLVGFAGQR